MSIYLDYNSSAPIDERVLDYMVSVYRNNIGNADSRTHDFGDGARKIVEEARRHVSSILDVSNDEVFFTSGSTESNNIIIQGLKEFGVNNNRKHIVTTSIEHKSVLECVKAMQKQGFEADIINPDISGRVTLEDICNRVRNDTLLVSIMHVNNETGIIQPIQEIGEFLKKRGILFHIDATQSFGKLVEELRTAEYDMLSMSAHKIAGPQGVGAMILKKKRYKLPPIRPIVYGGQQEHGIRPGTIPVALVAGLGKACEIAEEEYKQDRKHCAKIKETICNLLLQSGLEYGFNGDQQYCVPSTMNIYLKGVSSEALMLSSREFCGISNGSACNSNSYKPSYVLTAMGIPTDIIENSIRVSWGKSTKEEEVRKSFLKVIEVAKGLAW